MSAPPHPEVPIERIGLDASLVLISAQPPQPDAAVDSELADAIAWRITGAQQHGVDGAAPSEASDVVVFLDDGTEDSTTYLLDELRNATPGDRRTVFIATGPSWPALRPGLRRAFEIVGASPNQVVALVLVLNDIALVPGLPADARATAVAGL